jgi:hypothetical protein
VYFGKFSLSYGLCFFIKEGLVDLLAAIVFTIRVTAPWWFLIYRDPSGLECDKNK